MSNERKEIIKPEIEIDADLIAQFEELPNGLNRHQWTETEDFLLLKYWPIKTKDAVSKKLGLPVDTCRKRYKELAERKK